jgi:hypothetical protein
MDKSVMSSVDPTNTSTVIGKSLSQIAALLAKTNDGQGRAIPPLDKWNPQFCGAMNLIIKANGEWWHEGSKIQREAMVRLFSTVLWREGSDYFLKTPVEKIQIQVEDVPLLVTEVEQVEADGQHFLRCRTQTGDLIVVDEQHPVFLREYEGQQRPYIRVRWDLEALIQRSAFYHLLSYGEFDESVEPPQVTLQSGDFRFSLVAE